MLATGFWIWAFSPFARNPHPDTLSDNAKESFSSTAQKMCDEIFPDGKWEPGREIASIRRNSNLTDSEKSMKRAEFARRAESGMDEMLNQLKELRGSSDFPETKDRELLDKWLIDWEQYLNDHKAWAAQLELGKDEEFRNTAIDGTRPKERLDEFARRNKMPSCGVPDFV